MKFGGSSVRNGERITNVTQLVERWSKGNQLVVVTSAMDSTTDDLFVMAEKAKGGEASDDRLEEIQKKHHGALLSAVKDSAIREKVHSEVSLLISELRTALTGVRSLKELTPRSLDYITSFGERLMVPILAGSLESVGLRVKHFTGGEAGILTDETFGEATPLMNITKHRVKKTLSPLLEENIIPVVTGFNGVTQHGEISTIGRGGSDYTAMIIGSSLDVDEVLIWSDVDGIMTADPRIIEGAKVIKQLSYDEAAEMAIMGARGMHPRALEPAKDGSIPVRIKNSFNSEAEGTLISKELYIHTGEVAKAIASINDLAMISLSGMSMVGKPGMAGEIFGVLARAKVNIIMISQSISESNITLMVRKSQLPKALSSLELALLGKGTVREITFEDDVSVISIVGAGMKGAPGVAAKLFGAVAEHDINVRMIAQGSSELNISFVVKEKDSAEATRIIHERFNMVN